ncbi:MAG: hypothetical protein J0I06_17815 [Planctomycetes bacterium]|nr:hypothetical protein [Planctomycetota bacterium]
MPRLTLRTLLAYIDDTLEPVEARSLGKKVAESEEARQLVDRIKKVTRRRGLAAPTANDEDDATADPNTVAAYLDNALDSATVRQVEETCLESDVHLAEVAACHQILTLVLTEPVRVPPRAHRRMYELVQPPAAVPNRRPSKSLPISGSAPSADGPVDADDADAALLLGMKRYSSSSTWAARFVLLAAVAVLLVLLAGAVVKTLLPPNHPQPPEVAQRPAAPAEPRPTPPEPPPAGPKPKGPDTPPVKPRDKGPDVAEVKPKDKGPEPADAGDMIPPPRPVGPDPWAGIDPPLDRRDPIGRVDTDHVLVVSQRGKAGWGRLPFKPDTDNPNDPDSVFSTDPVMALPGHQAVVKLGEFKKPVLAVTLWGNVPEQLPYRVFESKVTFHQPPPNFDADITLHAGRIYLKNQKAVAEKGALVRVRVRLANTKEVWDLTLPDVETDVLVELISWFRPGARYAVKGGEEPKREARAAVLGGPAAFFASEARFKKFQIAPDTQAQWDSGTGALSEPVKIPNMEEVVRVPTLAGVPQKVVRGVLSDMADAVTQPDRVRTVLKVRLDPPETMVPRDLIQRLAIYSWAALADSDAEGCDTLRDLVAILNSELQWLGRQAVVTALVQWVARDRGNTALLHALLGRDGSGIPAEQVDAVIEMLRGFVSPTQPDPGQLDKLLLRLGGVKSGEFEKQDPAIALRDIALWNLVVADRGVWIPPPVGVNVGAIGNKFDDPEYRKFLKDWRARVDDIKRRPPPVPKTP